MSWEPLVSIVIPVYNGSAYLGAAIESALGQKYGNLEVLVINDGSDDDGRTERVAKKYCDRIRYFGKANGGVSSALNCGIREMRGELFSWLSHDDAYYSDKITIQVEYLEKHPSVSVVGSGLDIMDEAGEILSKYDTGREVVIRTGRELLSTWVYGCSLLIRRSVFDKVGTFAEENKTIQDLDLWIRMLAAGIPIVLLPDRLCRWRRHSAMGSIAMRRLVFEECEIFFETMLERYPLSFFEADPGAASSARGRTEIYDWLGEQARHRGASRTATRCFRRAALTIQNPLRRRYLRVLRKYLSRVVCGVRDPV